jgi:hypothetical protein
MKTKMKLKLKLKSKNSTRTVNKRQKKRKTKRKLRKSYKKLRLMKGGGNETYTTPSRKKQKTSPYTKTPSKPRSVFEFSDTKTDSGKNMKDSPNINYYFNNQNIQNIPESALYPIGSNYEGDNDPHIILSNVRTGAGGTITINDKTVTKEAFPEEDNLIFEYLVGDFLQEITSDFKNCFIKFNKVIDKDGKKTNNTPTLINSYSLQSLSMPYIQGKTLGAFLRESWDSNGQEKLNTFYCILLQVYTALYCYQNVFTHGDLHVENVLLEEAPNDEVLTFVFNKKSDNATIFDFTPVVPPPEKPFITFTCKYKIKIIDFGRAWYPEVEELCNYVDNEGEDNEVHNARTKVCQRRNHPLWTIHNQNVSQDLRLLQSCIDCLPTYSKIEISLSSSGQKIRKCELFDIPFIFNDVNARIIPPDSYEMHYKTEEIVESGYANNIIYNIVDAMYFLADLVEPVVNNSTDAITKTIKKITLDDIRMKYKINLDDSFAAVDDTQYTRIERTKRTFDQFSTSSVSKQ